METLTVLQICGLLGVAGYIGSFMAVQFDLMRGDSCSFSLLNILSAAFVLISLTEHFNLASALIQISWIVIGVSGLLFRLLRKSKNGDAIAKPA